MAGLTLVEAAKRETGNVHRQAVIEQFARAHPLLSVMPFRSIAGNAYSYEQEANLPAVAFRGVNEAYTTDAGVLNPVTERLAIAGGDLDVDRFIVNTQGAGQRASREAMKIKSLAHTIAHKIIKGDSDTDPKEFDGLQKRVSGGQKIANGSTSGGDVLSMAKLDELIDAVEGENRYLLMSKALRRRLTVAAKTTSISGYVQWRPNEFGQQVMFYNDIPIVPMDGNVLANQTLAFNEANPGGGSSVGTSIYCVSFGDGQFEGIQNGEMSVRDLGEIDTQAVFRTRVEWYVGLAVESGYSVGRLWGIKDGAAAA